MTFVSRTARITSACPGPANGRGQIGVRQTEASDFLPHCPEPFTRHAHGHGSQHHLSLPHGNVKVLGWWQGIHHFLGERDLVLRGLLGQHVPYLLVVRIPC